MIPQKPEILKAPLVVDGEKNILPETTPQGSNQFSLLGGFPTLTSLPINAGGLPPKRLDFNAVFNLLSIHTFFLQSGSKYSWDALLDYSAGATVLGSDNSVYFCIQPNGATPPNTVQDPVASTGYWVEIINYAGKINADTLSVVLGAFSTLNSLALTDNKLTGILPLNKGGTEAQNATEARKNLDTYNQYTLPNNADLNNLDLYLKNSVYIYKNGVDNINRPTGAQTGFYETYIDTNFDRGWQRFYSVGINGQEHLRYFGRTYDKGQWGPWKTLREPDGSIPTELGGKPKFYTNSDGNWTETPLNNGKILLEGWGITLLQANETKRITIPTSKSLSSAAFVGSTQTDIYCCNFMVESSKPVIKNLISSLVYANWNYKVIIPA